MAYPRYYFKLKNTDLECLTDKEIELAISLYQRKVPIEKIKNQLNIKDENREFFDTIPYEKWMGCLCGAVIYFKLQPINEEVKTEFLCPSCGIDSVEFKKKNGEDIFDRH